MKKPPWGQGGFFSERGHETQQHNLIMHNSCDELAGMSVVWFKPFF